MSMSVQAKPEALNVTPEQIVFYQENGYLVVDDVIPRDECEQVIAAIIRHVQAEKDLDFQSIMNMDREDTADGQLIRRLMFNHRIVQIMDTLQGTGKGELVAMQSHINCKWAGTASAGQAWNPHQDNANVEAPLGDYITANVALTNQSIENGCMILYPGSHRLGILPAEKMKSFREDPGQRPGHDCSQSIPAELQARAVDVPLKQGAVMILHGECIHASRPNLTADQHRPMVLMVYQWLKFRPGLTARRTVLKLDYYLDPWGQCHPH